MRAGICKVAHTSPLDSLRGALADSLGALVGMLFGTPDVDTSEHRILIMIVEVVRDI